jgi:hypothetical protein
MKESLPKIIKNPKENTKNTIEKNNTCAKEEINNEITLTIPLHSKIENNKYEIAIVTFVLRMMKNFFKKKNWFSSPTLLEAENGVIKLSNLKSCLMRDVVEDFRFYLRQYFADYGDQVMPAFQYTNQTSLSAMALKLGFRVVKPQNKFRLHYYSV